jgi:amino acid transporter
MTQQDVKPVFAPTGVFTRASSGLVRQVRTDDVMFYGWQQIALGYIIFIVAAWQFYPGASMELATLIATVTGLFIAMCYSLLSVVYPRSGGDYVFMSRIISPSVGLSCSISLIFWQLFYVGVNGAFLSRYGFAPLFSALGLQMHSAGLIHAGNWFAGRWGLFAGGNAVILFFCYLQYRGMGIYFKAQRWACYVAMVSLAITFITLILGATHVFNFEHDFNNLAGSNAYQDVINAAKASGDNLHHSFSLKESLFFAAWPAFSLWFAVLSVSFGGEVKDTQRAQLIGMNGAIITMGIFMAGLMFLYRMAFGSQFILASSEIPASKFPLNASPYVNLYTGIVGHNILLTIANSVWVIALLFFVAATSLVASTRSMLAWSLDGVAPRWFSQVSERYHTPGWSLVLCGAIAEVWVLLYAFTHLILVLGGFLGQCVPFLGVSLAAIIFPLRRKADWENSQIAYRWGKVAVISVLGVASFVSVGFCFYRLCVDSNYGANNHLSIIMTVSAFGLGFLWYYLFKTVRRAQGDNLALRFDEIPVE